MPDTSISLNSNLVSPTPQFIREINEENNVRTVFTEHIYQSFLAEVDGRVALVMILEGVKRRGYSRKL